MRNKDVEVQLTAEAVYKAPEEVAAAASSGVHLMCEVEGSSGCRIAVPFNLCLCSLCCRGP